MSPLYWRTVNGCLKSRTKWAYKASYSSMTSELDTMCGGGDGSRKVLLRRHYFYRTYNLCKGFGKLWRSCGVSAHSPARLATNGLDPRAQIRRAARYSLWLIKMSTQSDSERGSSSQVLPEARSYRSALSNERFRRNENFIQDNFRTIIFAIKRCVQGDRGILLRIAGLKTSLRK